MTEHDNGLGRATKLCLALFSLLQYTAKMFTWYSISRKQFIRKIRKINLTQNLSVTVSVLQYLLFSWTDILMSKLYCADVHLPM